MFRKLELFPSSGDGEETPNKLGPLERANLSHSLRANLNHWTVKEIGSF
jgi:hypothetical protein